VRRVVVLLLALSACRGAVGTAVDEQVDAWRAPLQGAEPAGSGDIQLHVRDYDFRLTPLATYRVAARVLGAERYYIGWRSDLAPVDLALGWGYMADRAVDRFIDWRQGGRWYFYRYSADSPYGASDIVPQSANVHIVPGSSNLRRALLHVAAGDMIILEGHLISARRVGVVMSPWTSSLTRTDSGDGACELMWVERLVRKGLEYK
jgi:hypothetical protein